MRQDFSQAVRAVFFQTDCDEFLYATDGGTLFLVSFQAKLYALTCKHAFGTFEPRQLFITQEKNAQKDSKPAPIKGRHFPSRPVDGAADTDVVDLCAVSFEDQISAEFFHGTPYVIENGTVGTSRPGHRLLVCGVLKSKSQIIPPDITMGFCQLEFHDTGPCMFDPFLRQAVAQFRQPEFNDVTGISGSPVFDKTAGRLCGMVVRGGMIGDKCRIFYMDISDIVRFLEGIRAGARNTYYTKVIETENRSLDVSDWATRRFAP